MIPRITGVLTCALLVAGAAGAESLLLANARVLDDTNSRWLVDHDVLIDDGVIQRIAPDIDAEADRVIDLNGGALLPGLIDLHTHLLLHPYDEASWNDQVLRESLALRTARAVVAAEATLRAGFTTIRDLGTEGAGYADVGIRDAINQGIIPGPRMLAVTRAIVATGAYGPSGFDPRWDMPVGAQVADGVDGVRIVVREQIAAGADWIKVYADYRRRPGDPSTPTFSQDELNAIVDEATSANIPVVAHASTPQAMRRAVLAGVKTIEHGYNASDDVLALMKEHDVILCPTLGASESMAIYGGWNPGEPDHARIAAARSLVQRALAAGVTIACGSDAGVFDHGDNAREIELMVEYGMSPPEALRAATNVAADVLMMGDELGRIAPGCIADIIVVEGDPLQDPGDLRDPVLVIQHGRIVR